MTPPRPATAALIVSTAVLLALSTVAHAAGGVITGYLRFEQRQGNYCPSISEGRDCSSAYYTEPEYLSYQRIRHVKVYVRNNANGSIIGQGSTDLNGTFTIQWYSSIAVNNATVFWQPEHKDGRYHIVDLNNQKYSFNAWTSLSLVNGTTAQRPQNLGSRGWGGTGSTTAVIANVMDGAWRMWISLDESPRMLAGFSGLRIVTFTTDENDCPTSCAHGKDNWIRLNTGAQYKPQARIFHEMGHIATYVANAHRPTGEYCFPDIGAGCSWNHADAEWRDVAFEEGFATFLGDRAIYGQAAPSPYTCNSTSYCSTNHDLEASLASSCDLVGEKHDRQPIQVNRFLRDLHAERQLHLPSDDNYVAPSGPRVLTGTWPRRPSARRSGDAACQRRASKEADGGNDQTRQVRPGRHEGGHGPQDGGQVRRRRQAAVGDEGTARLADAA